MSDTVATAAFEGRVCLGDDIANGRGDRLVRVATLDLRQDEITKLVLGPTTLGKGSTLSCHRCTD